jgi:uncharacterized protein YggE
MGEHGAPPFPLFVYSGAMTRTNLTRRTLPFAAFVTALAVVSSLPMRAQPPQPPGPGPRPVPSLVAQATGQVDVAPDLAVVRLGVVVQNPSARAAQEGANKVVAALLAAVRELGIDAKDLQTSQLNLNPIYAPYRPDGGEPQEPRITGYQASFSVSVQVTRLDLVGRVVDVGLAAGANQIEGVTFGLQNEQPARERALDAAIRQARRKAEVMAAALGVQLQEVLEVSEGGPQAVTPMFDKRMAFEASAAPTPVEPGQVTIDATVTVRWRIGS